MALGRNDGRRLGILAVVLVAAVALMIALPTVMSVVNTQSGDPTVADVNTDQRTAAKTLNQSDPQTP